MQRWKRADGVPDFYKWCSMYLSHPFRKYSSHQLKFREVYRHDISHMHHMQRMCKIFSPRVRFNIWLKGKFLNVGVYACVKKLTNIMSVLSYCICPRFGSFLVQDCHIQRTHSHVNSGSGIFAFRIFSFAVWLVIVLWKL